MCLWNGDLVSGWKPNRYWREGFVVRRRTSGVRRRLRFAAVLLGWLLVLVLGAAVADGERVGPLIVGGVLGLFVLIELVTPTTIKPRWQRRLSPILLMAVVLFVAIVGPRIYRLVISWA